MILYADLATESSSQIADYGDMLAGGGVYTFTMISFQVYLSFARVYLSFAQVYLSLALCIFS